MNVGSPASPDPRDIKPYLSEFLSDKNLVRVPHAVWLPILHGIILRTRPKKTSPRYQRIWTDKGSPLLVESAAQCEALNRRFADEGLNLVAAVGMRYGKPSADDAFAELEAQGCTKIVGFPLFPQTATCTVGTSKEFFLKKASKRTASKPYGIVEGYADNPLYIQALANSIAEHWDYQPGSKLLFSFHSIPLSDVESGDTYLEEIQTTLTGATKILGIPDEDWEVAYHSRFEDSRAWVAPHPKTVLSKWADEGISRVALVAPGFAADCLESLYDIDIVTREYFVELCNARSLQPDVTYVPALNAREDHINALYDIITNERYTKL